MISMDLTELKEAVPGTAWKHPRMSGYFGVLAKNEETGTVIFAFQPRKGNAYVFTIERDNEVKEWGLQGITAPKLLEDPSHLTLVPNSQLVLTGQLLRLLLSPESWLRGTVVDFDASRTSESEW
jgi:hypothetical protein